MIYGSQGTQIVAGKTAQTIISTANGRPRLIEYKGEYALHNTAQRDACF